MATPTPRVAPLVTYSTTSSPVAVFTPPTSTRVSTVGSGNGGSSTGPAVRFFFTGADQTYTVPAGVTSLLVKAWGAAGGSADRYTGTYGRGGSGAFVSATLSVTPGEVLTIIVGEGGYTRQCAVVSAPLCTLASVQQYGGGGTALATGTSYNVWGGRGGGLSAVASSASGCSASGCSGTYYVVAGGGGGASGNYQGSGGGGGYPSGLTAGSGYSSDAGSTTGPGRGGSQSAGGAGGTGYRGGTDATGGAGTHLQGGKAPRLVSATGSGGGGWYGGGGGAGYYNGGGGGSSYTDDVRCTSVSHVNGEVGSGTEGNGVATHPSAVDSDYQMGVGVAAIVRSPYEIPDAPISERSGHGQVVLIPLAPLPPPPPQNSVFEFTGADQQYTVPAGVTSLLVKVWGAGGGSGQRLGGLRGGSGAFVRATLSVTPNEVLKVIVGEGGWASSGSEHFQIQQYGHGSGGGVPYPPGEGTSFRGARGGGYSAITSSTASANVASLSAWYVVAGGGGGAGTWKGNGGGGGYPAGLRDRPSGHGSNDGEWITGPGQGGTQTAGGAGGGPESTGSSTICATYTYSMVAGGDGGRFTGGGKVGWLTGTGGSGWFGGGGGSSCAGYANVEEGGTFGGGGGSSYTDSSRCTNVEHVNGESGSGVAYSEANAVHPTAHGQPHADADYLTPAGYDSPTAATSLSASVGETAIRGGHGLVVIQALASTPLLPPASPPPAAPPPTPSLPTVASASAGGITWPGFTLRMSAPQTWSHPRCSGSGQGLGHALEHAGGSSISQAGCLRLPVGSRAAPFRSRANLVRVDGTSFTYGTAVCRAARPTRSRALCTSLCMLCSWLSLLNCRANSSTTMATMPQTSFCFRARRWSFHLVTPHTGFGMRCTSTSATAHSRARQRRRWAPLHNIGPLEWATWRSTVGGGGTGLTSTTTATWMCM